MTVSGLSENVKLEDPLEFIKNYAFVGSISSLCHRRPAQQKAPLKLLHSTPIPELKDGDFDHLTPDVAGNRLFVTAEENSKVLVFDLKTNKLIHTIADLKAPHSILYRADLKKLFVVDSDLGEVKISDTE